MTSEADFQAALDADPTDWQTRLVFADWLDERGAPRAEGYRALGALRRTPFPWRNPPDPEGVLRWLYHNGTGTYQGRPIPDEHRLPQDWIGAISKDGRTQPLIICYDVGDGTPLPRSAMEDAAARAFLKLPAARRATLLAGKLRRRR